MTQNLYKEYYIILSRKTSFELFWRKKFRKLNEVKFTFFHCFVKQFLYTMNIFSYVSYGHICIFPLENFRYDKIQLFVCIIFVQSNLCIQMRSTKILSFCIFLILLSTLIKFSFFRHFSKIYFSFSHKKFFFWISESFFFMFISLCVELMYTWLDVKHFVCLNISAEKSYI